MLAFIVPEHLLSVYSTPEQAYQINKILKLYIKKTNTITDATACIGGNSFFFQKDFKLTNIVEKDQNVFNTLIKNTNFLHCNYYNCSYLHIMYILRQDLVFLDPPWGGSEYKKNNKLDLFLDNVNIIDIINNLYHHAKYIAVKVPNNYNIEKINKNFWNWKIYSIKCNNKNIYNLVIFYK
jgi:16S rRNA G966 N2-methylase RsmD